MNVLENKLLKWGEHFFFFLHRPTIGSIEIQNYWTMDSLVRVGSVVKLVHLVLLSGLVEHLSNHRAECWEMDRFVDYAPSRIYSLTGQYSSRIAFPWAFATRKDNIEDDLDTEDQILQCCRTILR